MFLCSPPDTFAASVVPAQLLMACLIRELICQKNKPDKNIWCVFSRPVPREIRKGSHTGWFCFLLPSIVDVFSMLGIFMVKYLLFKRECNFEGIF